MIKTPDSRYNSLADLAGVLSGNQPVPRETRFDVVVDGGAWGTPRTTFFSIAAQDEADAIRKAKAAPMTEFNAEIIRAIKGRPVWRAVEVTR